MLTVSISTTPPLPCWHSGQATLTPRVNGSAGVRAPLPRTSAPVTNVSEKNQPAPAAEPPVAILYSAPEMPLALAPTRNARTYSVPLQLEGTFIAQGPPPGVK